MPDPTNGLTLEGLARILRDHMDGTAARFAEVGARIDDLRRELAGVAGTVRDLSQIALHQVGEAAEQRRENAEVAGMVRDLSQIMLRQMDDVAEHRRLHEEHCQHFRQVFARMERGDARLEEMNREFRVRMEQHDARFEGVTGEIREMRRDIRRILDAMEGRGGDGGGRQP